MTANDAVESVSIERLVVARGVQLTRKGDSLVGACPLHQGSKAKLKIDSQANTWSCSACGVEGGGAVEWIQRAEGVSRRHATELLRDGRTTLDRRNVGPRKGAVAAKTTVRTMGLPFSADDADDVILRGVAEFYHRTLIGSPDTRQALADLGLRHPQLAAHFRLGFANRTLGLRLPKTNRIAGRQLRERLQQLGVLRSDTGHEHLHGCLVVPVFDLQGKVVGLFGRRLDRARRGSAEDLWTNATKGGLVNPAAFASKEIVVTASIVDALAAWCHGITNATAVQGADGAVTEVVRAMQKHGTTRATLLLPRTREHEEAAAKIGATIAKLASVEVRRALLPSGADVMDVVRAAPDPGHAVLQLVRTAEWVAGSTGNVQPVLKAPTESLIEPSADEAGSQRSGADEVVVVFDDRRWRARGLSASTSPGAMKVNLFVSREGVGFHVNSFDLYSSRHRVAFVRQAGTELGLDEAVIRKDMGSLLLRLEQEQAEILRKLEAPKLTKVELSAAERDEALQLLRDPRLLDRVLDTFEVTGVVGEKDNLTLAYLAATSRKLPRPLGVILQSSSAAGKSSIMNAVLAFVPEEDRVAYSAMTGQSLFYAPGSNLRHKVLAIAEEQGAHEASYSLKLLQSEGSISIASTGKDPGSGRLVSQEYKVEGPVALLLTTTSIDIDEELANRCITLTVDESPEQTKRIHERQRRAQTLAGLLGHEARGHLLRLQQNAQRLLRQVGVVNPHADELAYPDLRVRARRDFRKLLTLIEASALLHQHQRVTKTVEHNGTVVEYVEASMADIEIATRLLEAVGAVGVNDLPPQTMRLLEQIAAFVEARTPEEKKFSRRELREALLLGSTQTKVHLRRLADAELLVVHRAPVGRGVLYELAYTCEAEGAGNGRPLVGLRPGESRGAVGPTEAKTSPTIPAADDDLGRDDPPERTSKHATPRAVRAGGAPS